MSANRDQLIDHIVASAKLIIDRSEGIPEIEVAHAWPRSRAQLIAFHYRGRWRMFTMEELEDDPLTRIVGAVFVLTDGLKR